MGVEWSVYVCVGKVCYCVVIVDVDEFVEGQVQCGCVDSVCVEEDVFFGYDE